jgi:hypothetical protein
MAEINYLERPAPSRLTPWPGNPVNELFENSIAMKHMGANNGRAGHKLKAGYDGIEQSFDSIREAADAMRVDAKSLGRNVNNRTVPQKDNIQWLEVDGYRFYKTKPVHTKKKVKAIIKGEEVIFDRVIDAMDFFMVTRPTILSWIRGACNRDNGVSYIGFVK